MNCDSDAGFQERADQSAEFAVAYAAAHWHHQRMMRKAIKAALDIAFNHPREGRRRSCPPARCASPAYLLLGC